MITFKEIIVVEGKYDKIKLNQITDAVVVTTDGFGIYKDEKKLDMIKRLAKERGIIILTDSDHAGFRIRNYIKQCLGTIEVKHAYIPEIKGKEKRKEKSGAEGILGVEGIDDEIIIDALLRAGATKSDGVGAITKYDFYSDGLSGGKDSTALRKAFARKLSLPEKISANALLDVVNLLCTYDEYKEIIRKIATK